MGKSTEELGKLIDEFRREGIRPDVASVLRKAKTQGIPIEADGVRWVAEQVDPHGMFLCPEFIPAFVASYLKESPPTSILDPWAETGGMLAPLVRIFDPPVAIGLCRRVGHQDIAHLLYQDAAIDWRLGHPFPLLDDIDDRFDVIVGCLPWGMQRESLTLTVEGRPVELRDNLEHLVMLKAAMLLEPDGVGFFVLGPRFLYQSRAGRVRSMMVHSRLFLEAALQLPAGSFAPVTGAGGVLVIVGREKTAQLFVGELSSDVEQSQALLGNLKARSEGRVAQLGALVDGESFHSLQALIAGRETDRLARDLQLPAVALSDVATQVNLARRGAGEPFTDLPNAVYLPLIGRSPAVSSLADIQMKPHNYAQIVFDPDQAIATYVANSLNTALGQRIRESLSSGFIPKISKSRLVKATVYLPDLPTQAEVVRIHSLIADSSTQLDILERQLWNQPRMAEEVEQAVRSLNPESDFEIWIETLPFPLASILWAFHAETNPHRRVDYLLHFFEALAQFTVMVMLSAFKTDTAFYDEHSGYWLDTDPKHRDWIMAPSFGNWVVVGRRLAKTTRRLLSDRQSRDRCLELFRASDSDFPEMLASKKVFGLLDEVSEYRNRWRGHGGVEGTEEAGKRLSTLAASLSEVRRQVSDGYAAAMLLSPGKSEFEEGIFNYEVKALMGTRVPFKKLPVPTLTPMDARRLYVLHSNMLKPVELLPLLRFGPGPRTEPDACYFYNGRERDGIRWVSYHFEKEADVTIKDPDVESALSVLYHSNQTSQGGR